MNASLHNDPLRQQTGAANDRHDLAQNAPNLAAHHQAKIP
jgi:hypothetical protein